MAVISDNGWVMKWLGTSVAWMAGCLLVLAPSVKESLRGGCIHIMFLCVLWVIMFGVLDS